MTIDAVVTIPFPAMRDAGVTHFSRVIHFGYWPDPWICEWHAHSASGKVGLAFVVSGYRMPKEKIVETITALDLSLPHPVAWGEFAHPGDRYSFQDFADRLECGTSGSGGALGKDCPKNILASFKQAPSCRSMSPSPLVNRLFSGNWSAVIALSIIMIPVLAVASPMRIAFFKTLSITFAAFRWCVAIIGTSSASSKWMEV